MLILLCFFRLNIENSLEQLPFSNPLPPELQKNIAHSNARKLQNNDREEVFWLVNQNFYRHFYRGKPRLRKRFIRRTDEHHRSRREIDTTLKSSSPVVQTDCANNTFTIKYKSEYEVSNDFLITYRGQEYYYNQYRVTDNGLQICNSPNYVIQLEWLNVMEIEKENLAFKNCNASVDGFFLANYTLFKNFTVSFHPTQQSFTRQDYGVVVGHFSICSAKLSSSCNENLVKVRYGQRYKVFKNFSLSYRMKHYEYREYRLGHDTFELCASKDPIAQIIWRTRNSWDKLVDSFFCPNTLKTINKTYYFVSNQFKVFLAGSAQSIKKYEYMVLHGQLLICGENLKPDTPNFTRADMLLCNDSLVKIKLDEQYLVGNDFSLLFKNKVYSYTEYRVLDDSINICNSSGNYVQDSWRLRNYYVKRVRHFLSCKRGPQKKYWYAIYQQTQFTVSKDFSIRLSVTKQVIPNYDYGVIEGKVQVCVEKLIQGVVAHFKLISMFLFCAVGLSIICLLLFFIIYGMLSELRTLPGLNLMSLCFAFLLWLTNCVFALSLYVRAGEVFKIPCDQLEITSRFTMNSIFTNAAVNIYHLRKTFCRNTLVKSDENKWRTFFKYSLFSWGVPVVFLIIYIVLVSKDVLGFHQSTTEAYCVDSHYIPGWLALIEKFGLPCCLLLYVITMFIFTGYRIHQKLKASSSIAQKSNIVKKRKSFVLLLKLSTTTAISWIPLFLEKIALNFSMKVVLSTVMLLSGVYVSIAFVFTTKNYHLLKKKYFSAKKKAVNHDLVGRNQ